MSKRESTFPNMVLTLFLVTFIASAALGFVYDMTKDAIEEAKLKAQNEAIEMVLPEYERLGDPFMVAPKDGGDSLQFFPAYNGDQLVGVAVKSYSNKGFSGFISVMAGIDASGNFSGYQILEHAETPGLGSKMDIWFNDPAKPNQYVLGKNPNEVKFTVSKDGGEIDAITASTITSRAFLEAMVRAWQTYDDNMNNAGNTGI